MSITSFRGLFAATAVLALLTMGSCAQPPAPSPSGTPSDPVTASESPTNTGVSIVLSSTGIGQFVFADGFGEDRSVGSTEEEVLDYLTGVLGTPVTGGGIQGCGYPRNKWGGTAWFYDLGVSFVADDDSPDSPRYLYAWEWRSVSAPEPPLVLAPGIPFGLSLDDLKAQYPGGDEMENMGAYFVNGVAFIPEKPDFAYYSIYAGQLNWCD